MIEVNREGKLTRDQRIYLLRRFLVQSGFILLLLGCIFWADYGLKEDSSRAFTFDWFVFRAFKIIGIIVLFGCTTIYTLDLFWTKPVRIKGILSKVQEPAGRSVLYWVIMGSHKILTTERIWLSLQTGAAYELTYAQWTKQLLSYEQLSTE